MIFKKHNNCLIPFDEDAKDYLAGLSPSDTRSYFADAKLLDPMLHRKFHKMIQIAYESQNEIKGRDNFRKYLYLQVGHHEVMKYQGIIVAKAKSSSGLSKEAFRQLFLDCYLFINKTYGDVIPEEFTETFF